ncbi:hypothetical protein K493DRAFT_319029 [Basidiobolus meristosporus CBS 931.73]|uniref:Uncharacterized protein n=1 Tax=Basidiobolus meristosporus CBS 931.73 TaxID=1314790 RepID=A0A1Y1XTE2_9FUNG|nr:hypothetical protein K493DRAFT_319029 [Basidiobolus meristosporus CBS 931.73]|eukprot:ORX89021.1 hypothetical protein K493DRAFT_319029 [Basidiobolus meristosporus CBS 931.73]
MLKKFFTLFCLVCMLALSSASPMPEPEPAPQTPAPLRFIRDIGRVAIATADDFILTPISNILTGGRGFPWQRRRAEAKPAANNSNNNNGGGNGNGPGVVNVNQPPFNPGMGMNGGGANPGDGGAVPF